jgi:hypothetical protein
MKVLATTSHSILAIDCETGDARIVHRGCGLYYGIARRGSDYFIAARRRLVSSPVPRDDERGCLLRFDTGFDAREPIEAPFALRDMHQIAYVDDRLFVTCSFDDAIAIFDGVRWERWIPELPTHVVAARPRCDEANDRFHYNSFFVGRDEIALLAHNHGPSNLDCFDRGSRVFRRTLPLGVQAHNVWSEGDRIWTCSSMEGKLVADDGSEVATGGFPRGVAFAPHARAFGLSALSERGQRDWASAAIALCDSAWRPRQFVHLSREGMILDLLALTDAEFEGARRGGLERVAFPVVERLDVAALAPDQGSAVKASS